MSGMLCYPKKAHKTTKHFTKLHRYQLAWWEPLTPFPPSLHLDSVKSSYAHYINYELNRFTVIN